MRKKTKRNQKPRPGVNPAKQTMITAEGGATPMWNKLEASKISELIGISVGECDRLLSETKRDFQYRHLTKEERDKLIIRILEKIDDPKLTLAGIEGKNRWEKGWQENLDNFILSGYAPEALIPKYIRPNQPIRLFGDYVMPLDPQIVEHF